VSRSHSVNSSSAILTALIPFPSKTAVLWLFNSPSRIKCTYLGLLGKVRFLPDYNHIWVLLTHTFRSIKFYLNSSSGASLIHAERRKNGRIGMTKLIGTFREYTKHLKHTQQTMYYYVILRRVRVTIVDVEKQ